MNFIYVLLPEKNPGWDDMRIYLDEQKAIEASILLPEYRVEIFELLRLPPTEFPRSPAPFASLKATSRSKIDSVDGSYIPSLNYYKCGIFITPYN